MSHPPSRQPFDPQSNWQRDHFANRPPDVERWLLEHHYGEIAGWQLDGRAVHAVAPTIAELRLILAEKGYALSEVVIEPIGEPDWLDDELS